MSDPLDKVAETGPGNPDMHDLDAHGPMRLPLILLAGAGVLIVGVVFVIVVMIMRLVGTASPAAVAGQGAPQTVASAPAVLDKDAEITALRNQIALLQSQATPAPSTPSYAADPAALAQLSARLDRVEANQRAFARAAMVASAAEALEAAARSGAPFQNQLAVLEPGLDDPNLAAPLRPYADKGIATEVDLAVRFPRVAASANIAARADSGDGSLFTRALHALGSFISIRRTDHIDGQGTEAILQRAENRLNLGDLSGAVGYLDTLKPAPHKAIEPWLADARARLLVDDTTSRLTAAALSRMTQINAPATNQGAAL